MRTHMFQVCAREMKLRLIVMDTKSSHRGSNRCRKRPACLHSQMCTLSQNGYGEGMDCSYHTCTLQTTPPTTPLRSCPPLCSNLIIRMFGAVLGEHARTMSRFVVCRDSDNLLKILSRTGTRREHKAGNGGARPIPDQHAQEKKT